MVSTTPHSSNHSFFANRCVLSDTPAIWNPMSGQLLLPDFSVASRDWDEDFPFDKVPLVEDAGNLRHRSELKRVTLRWRYEVLGIESGWASGSFGPPWKEVASAQKGEAILRGQSFDWERTIHLPTPFFGVEPRPMRDYLIEVNELKYCSWSGTPLILLSSTGDNRPANLPRPVLPGGEAWSVWIRWELIWTRLGWQSNLVQRG